MNQFQRNYVNENAKNIIKNMPVPSFEHSISSFAESRNELSKVHHRTIEDSPQSHEMSLFPTNNDPSIILIDGQSIIDMNKKGPSFKQSSLEKLAQQNNQLQKKIAQLEDRLYRNDKIDTEQNTGSDKKTLAEVHRLKAQITQKDKKNIELFNLNRELAEQLRISKQEIQTKTKQLSSKNLEIKKQRQRTDSLLKNKQTQRSDKMNDRVSELVQELAKRESDFRRLKNENASLFDDNQDLKLELENLKLQYLNEIKQQANRYKFKIQELSERIKTQSVSRSNSIRGSTVSSASLSDSFSPEMLSPEETVDLIFHVLRKISKSQMMLRILYSNSNFLSLIQEFATRRYT